MDRVKKTHFNIGILVHSNIGVLVHGVFYREQVAQVEQRYYEEK